MLTPPTRPNCACTIGVCLRWLLCFSIAGTLAFAQDFPVRIASPDGALTFSVYRGADSDLVYEVQLKGESVINASRLGLDIEGQPTLTGNMKLISAKTASLNETYTMPHGKASSLRDHCNTLELVVEENGELGRRMILEARIFDDAVAFRYRLPPQADLRTVRLRRELTEFRLAREGVSFPLILSGFHTSYEDSYVRLPLTSIKPDALVALPFLTEVPGVAWVAITESNLENYAGLYLRRKEGLAMTATLSPRPDDPTVAVSAAAPLQSPWRVVMVAPRVGQLIESNAVLNLAAPSRLKDSSWVKPGKTSWSWWSGDYARNVDFKPGMNTETLKHYIDFSAEAGLEYVLIDAGWAKPLDRTRVDLLHTADQVDLKEILRYAAEKKVGVWLWAHWTSVDEQMNAAFAQFEKWGIKGVKIDFMDRDDQDMVAFYHRVAQRAAAHHLMVDFHGAYKPTGLARTYPNVLTYEGVMGMEYMKWSARVNADHDVMLPFTRMLAGPMDYTPGGFNNVPPSLFKPQSITPMVPTTRAHQLGLYVVFESALQMLADYPGAYKGQPELEFLKAVPSAWDETRFLEGVPGEYIVMARRKGETWFVGGLAGGEGREVKVALPFLTEGRWRAEVYGDGPETQINPTRVQIQNVAVGAETGLTVKMAPTGGFAAVIRPVRAAQ